MKSLSMMATLAIFCSFACKKVILKPISPTVANASSSAPTNSLIENLGTAVKGSNVLWKINPSAENMEPLITFQPNSNSGFVAVMIDNGNMGSDPFKFIAVDLQTNTSKTIRIKTKNGIAVTQSVGRITRYMFGMNKKLYVVTENGGHLIEYDPNLQTATDLGQPFIVGGRVLDIYSLSVGKDGALYGGSFGSSGDVYTFRYDYNNNFYVDQASLDNEAKYVTYVTGDDKYTYASCGQNSWSMIAIERATGKKTVLLHSASPSDRIYTSTFTGGCYAQFSGKNYRLDGVTATVSGTSGSRVEYLPYKITDPTLPKIVWSECDKRVYYKFPGGVENHVTVNDITDEVYSVGAMSAVGNKLFLSGGKVPRFVVYDQQTGFSCIGTTSLNVYLMAVVPGTGGTKMVMGGYPKGAMLEYKTTDAWTVGTETISYTPPEITSTKSNPRKFVQLQDADNSGIFGPMTLNGIFYTRDGSMIAAGNNDRLTESGSRELAIGTFKNGTKRNFTIPEFAAYEFKSMTLSLDSSEVYISAVSKFNADGKIFKYNPVTNTIASTISFPQSADPGFIQMYDEHTIAGAYNNVLYLLDVNSKSIIYKETLNNGERINAMTIAPDKSIWLNHAYLNAFTSRFVKYTFAQVNKSIKATATEVTVFKSPDPQEGAKTNGMLFVKSQSQPNSYDLYLSGFLSLCRMKNAVSI